MEKRVRKVEKYRNDVLEAKQDVVETLNGLVGQVSRGLDRIKSGGISQKVLYEFLSFEMKIIQKFEEFNYFLETIEHENPLTQHNHIESTELAASFCETGATNMTFNHSTSSGLIEPDYVELSRSIRGTLMSAGEKLGLNDQNISTMRQFYAKNQSVPCEISSNIESVPLHFHSSIPDQDQIPEKDVNPLLNINAQIEIEQNRTSGSDNDNSEESSEVNFDLTKCGNHDNANPTTSNISAKPLTAIVKLNNLRQNEDRKGLKLDIEPYEFPDLKLIASVNTAATNAQSTVVIRNFETQKPGQGKNNNLDILNNFALQRKSAPKVDATCVFSHIETPSDFYIHVVDDDSTKIDKISEDIKQIADKQTRYKSKKEAQKDIKKYGVVYITGYANWYRMEVLDWYEGHQSGDVLVRLVDYGNKQTVSYAHLGKMSEEIARIPMLAVHCHLVLMYPPNSTPLNRLTEWPRDSVDQFKEISGLLRETEVFFQVRYSFWNSDLQSVEIDLVELPDGNYSVGEILLQLGLVEQIVDEYENEEEDLHRFLEDVDTLERADNINEAITGYDARDEVRICRFTKPDGTCYKGKNCKLEHAQLPKEESHAKAGP